MMTKSVINITRFIPKDASYASLIPLARCHHHALGPGFSFIPSPSLRVRSHLQASFLSLQSLLDLSPGLSFSATSRSQAPIKSHRNYSSSLFTGLFPLSLPHMLLPGSSLLSSSLAPDEDPTLLPYF